jgi:hypothetical protein
VVDLFSTKQGEFACEAHLEGKRIDLLLLGVADLRTPPFFEEQLVRVHNEAVRRGTEEVAVDMRKLSFMSSSCILKFVTWLARLEDPTTKYRVRFLCSADYHWQLRSIQSLRVFGAGRVAVQVTT